MHRCYQCTEWNLWWVHYVCSCRIPHGCVKICATLTPPFGEADWKFSLLFSRRIRSLLQETSGNTQHFQKPHGSVQVACFSEACSLQSSLIDNDFSVKRILSCNMRSKGKHVSQSCFSCQRSQDRWRAGTASYVPAMSRGSLFHDPSGKWHPSSWHSCFLSRCSACWMLVVVPTVVRLSVGQWSTDFMDYVKATLPQCAWVWIASIMKFMSCQASTSVVILFCWYLSQVWT